MKSLLMFGLGGLVAAGAAVVVGLGLAMKAIEAVDEKAREDAGKDSPRTDRTVGELIDELSALDPAAQVFLEGEGENVFRVRGVSKWEDGTISILRGREVEVFVDE